MRLQAGRVGQGVARVKKETGGEKREERYRTVQKAEGSHSVPT